MSGSGVVRREGGNDSFCSLFLSPCFRVLLVLVLFGILVFLFFLSLFGNKYSPITNTRYRREIGKKQETRDVAQTVQYRTYSSHLSLFLYPTREEKVRGPALLFFSLASIYLISISITHGTCNSQSFDCVCVCVFLCGVVPPRREQWNVVE